MIVLYNSGGAGDFKLLTSLPDEQWERFRQNTRRLLEARQEVRAAELLNSIEFQLFDATNHFNDEFSVLCISIPLERYIYFEQYKANQNDRAAFAQIAKTISEIGGPFIRFIAADLNLNAGPQPVASPSLKVTTEAVERALADSERLLSSTGAVSTVDRIHTALHGYLRTVCDEAGITVVRSDSLPQLLKFLQQRHPAFQTSGPYTKETGHILRSILAILDTLRNRASLAHPNEALIAEPEAMLAINCVRTILHYINAKQRPT